MRDKQFYDSPQFSIVTVCYNARDTLEETIKSVIQQEYENYEYIIIDGGSIDGTKTILNKYRSYIDILISENDNGIYDAMNKGLKVASGKFVNFLNSGDKFFNRQTLKLVSKNINNNVKVISGDFILVNESTNLKKYIKTRKLLLMSLKRGFYSCHQSIFIDLITAPEFDESYKIQADYLWVIESVSQVSHNEILKIDVPIVYYSQEGTSFRSVKTSIKELILLQNRKFGMQVVLNLDVYLKKILRTLRNELLYKKFCK